MTTVWNYGALFQVLRQAKEDGIVIAHCENDGVVNYLRGWDKAQGLTQPIYHARSRPARSPLRRRR